MPFTRGLSTRLERELERMDLSFQPSPLAPKYTAQKKLKQQLFQGIQILLSLLIFVERNSLVRLDRQSTYKDVFNRELRDLSDE